MVCGVPQPSAFQKLERHFLEFSGDIGSYSFLPSLARARHGLNGCTNRCTKTSLRCPMKPTVADSRTPNRLILRGPAGDLPPVTAEAAGSSPVVPAILFKQLQMARVGSGCN